MKNHIEESGELFSSTWNDPTPEQLEEMLSESADVILNVLQALQGVGVSAEVATQAILNKIQLIGDRPASHFERGIRPDTPPSVLAN
jgi:hypothetical protein